MKNGVMKSGTVFSREIIAIVVKTSIRKQNRSFEPSLDTGISAFLSFKLRFEISDTITYLENSSLCLIFNSGFDDLDKLFVLSQIGKKGIFDIESFRKWACGVNFKLYSSL